MITMRGEARPLPALSAQEIEAIAQRVAEILRDQAKINKLAAPPPARVAPASPPPRILRRILSAVADASGVSEIHLLSRRRARGLARPRHIAIYLACERTAFSLPEIGRFFDRDHTSVMHGRRIVAEALEAGEGWATWLYQQSVARLDMAEAAE